MTKSSLERRISSREVAIGVIGLGYVGLPLSLAFTEAGFTVHGFDIDEFRVGQLQDGGSYVDDVSDEELSAGLESGFSPSSKPHSLANCDVYIITVPTDMADDEPDMSAVKSASETVAAHLKDTETLVVVSSTVYPGATQEVVKPIFDLNGEQPVHFAMVPERLNPGGNDAFNDIPLVVGADTDAARTAAETLFDTVVTRTHPVGSIETAELTKTLENTYRMVNIALVNELITLAEGLEADVWEAIDAAATKPFGFQAFRPGPGVGGHCIPVDPQFLSWRAKDIGTDVSFLDDAHRINERMPGLVADRLETLLRARGVDLTDASVIVLGAAYKPNVGDTRNSPALRVVENLPEPTEVTVVDPHTDAENVARELVRSPADLNIAAADAVVLLVDHDAFDLRAIGEQATFVFDTRNTMPDDVPADVIALGEFVDEQMIPVEEPLHTD